MGPTPPVIGNLPPPEPADLAEFRKQTRSLYDANEAAVAAADPEPLLERFYVADAMSFGPDAKIIRGREQLRGCYEDVAKTISSIIITSVHAYVNGNLGWDWANIENNARDGSKIHVAILFLWVRVDGRWISAGNAYTVSPDKPIAW